MRMIHSKTPHFQVNFTSISKSMRFILFEETLEMIYQNVIPVMLSFCPKFNKAYTRKNMLESKALEFNHMAGR